MGALLNRDRLLDLAVRYDTPLFVYFREEIDRQINKLVALEMPYGYTPRYAMKANHHPDVVRHITSRGVGIDASSSHEAEAAMKLGVVPELISLTSQQSAHNLTKLIDAGIQYNATSQHQLEQYGIQFSGTSVGVRINPGIGSGFSRKANVGGPTSSFGIWHEQIDAVKGLAVKYNLIINRVHTHIGSGTDLREWEKSIELSLAAAEQFADITTINLGGGFKVARMLSEQSTSITKVGDIINQQITAFAQKTGKSLRVELEPGGFLVANAGYLLAEVDDIVSTGEDGYIFLKLNTGMNDILRPTLYAAQHPIEVLNDATENTDYVVVGHNCESGDLLSPSLEDAETIETRTLKTAEIGDVVAVAGVGAYCASMAAHGYNGFPSAKEILV